MVLFSLKQWTSPCCLFHYKNREILSSERLLLPRHSPRKREAPESYLDHLNGTTRPTARMTGYARLFYKRNRRRGNNMSTMPHQHDRSVARQEEPGRHAMWQMLPAESILRGEKVPICIHNHEHSMVRPYQRRKRVMQTLLP